MANDGNDDNKIEHLLQHSTTGPGTNPPPSLIPLPEQNEVTLSDRIIIFGPFPPSHHDSSSLLIDTLFQKSSPSAFAGSSSTLHPLLPPTEHNLPGRSRLHRSKTAPAMVANYNDVYHPINQKTESSDSKFPVREAVALLIVYVSLGLLIYWLNRDGYIVNETHPVVDVFYFCIVTICTFGYGDITPDSVSTKLLSIMFVLVGFGFMGLFLSEVVTRGVKKGKMRIWLKVGLALGFVVLCLGFGGLVIHFIEKIGWLNSFYFSVVSVTTVGYGDRAFKTLPGRLIAAIWLLLSTLAVAQVFLYSTDKRKRERERRECFVKP